MNVARYLQRINYHGPTTPSPDTLRALQLAHLRAVPFENLSIHAGEPIVLNDVALFDKIVQRRRGGFCYECNGLFAALLRALGFDVAMLSAEVANTQGGYTRPFDHMVLMVKETRRWLVDVGFGDSFLHPLLLDERGEQAEAARAYRIAEEGEYLVLRQGELNDWQAQYRFTLQPYDYGGFAEMCRYHQTSPQSHFTQKRICSLATETGRITLSDMRLIEASGSERHERVMTNQEEYDAALLRHFGVVMTRSVFHEPD